MVDDPKKPFNERGNPNFRDKDNAAPRPTPPPQAKYPAPNLAPPGMSGIHLSRYDGPDRRQTEEPNQEQVKSIVKTHPKPELLTGGRFMDRPGTGFAVEVSPYRSFHGIEGGKVTALEIQEEGKIIAQYQGLDWKVKPKNEEHLKLVERLQDQFGEPRKVFEPIVPHDKDKDKTHER